MLLSQISPTEQKKKSSLSKKKNQSYIPPLMLLNWQCFFFGQRTGNALLFFGPRTGNALGGGRHILGWALFEIIIMFIQRIISILIQFSPLTKKKIDSLGS